MKIYFACSIHGGREQVQWYTGIAKYLKAHGTILNAEISDSSFSLATEAARQEEIHEQNMLRIIAADVLVAEVTAPSLGVGYEIGRAVENGKRVLALYRPSAGNPSAMIVGSDKLTTKAYETLEDAKTIIFEFLAHGNKKSVQTLVVVHQGERVLLGQKKRGFGAGYWNGFGGKVHANETIAQNARRELEEEAGIGTTEVHKRGVLNFWFHSDPVVHEVHVFTVQAFTGTPKETDEMKPQWFAIADIPYDRMWPDDHVWLPHVLSGKHVTATFWFGKDGQVEKHEITTT